MYGDSLQPNLVAVVVPDPETLLPWAAARGLPQNLTRLISDPSVVAAVLDSMLEEGRTSRLQGFEQVSLASPCQTELAAHQPYCACKQDVLLSHEAPRPLLAQSDCGTVQVTAVTLVEEAFSVENGLLTPTMKLKRPQAKTKFQDAINR